jgi:hypothetical protein
MVKHGVDVYFQGHDHVYAHEMLDGVIYQTLPMPSDSTYSLGIEANGDAFTGVILDGCGHLRVSVSPECATVEYVQAWLPKDTLSGEHKNREVAHRFTIGNCTSGVYDQSEKQANVRIHPNPANHSVTMTTELFGASPGLATLLDPHGRQVAVRHVAQGEKTIVFDTQALAQGLYIVLLQNEKLHISKKFIVSHP